MRENYVGHAIMLSAIIFKSYLTKFLSLPYGNQFRQYSKIVLLTHLSSQYWHDYSTRFASFTDLRNFKVIAFLHRM